MRLLLPILVLGAACSRPNPAFVGQRGVDAAVLSGSDVRADVPGVDVAGADAASADLLGADRPYADLLSADLPAPADAVPASALLGHWTFEETVGDPMVMDRSGYDHHGRLENLDPMTARTAATRGQALSLSASAVNPGVMVPVVDSPIRSLQRFTIAAWVYRATLDDDDEVGLISRQLGTGPRQVFNLGFAGDELTIVLSQASGDHFTVTAGAAKTPVNTWFHIAATWDGNDLVLYQDGQRVAATTRAWTLPDTSNPLYLGTNKNDNNDEPLVGQLDEVRLYSVALTAGQIAALATDRVP